MIVAGGSEPAAPARLGRSKSSSSTQRPALSSITGRSLGGGPMQPHISVNVSGIVLRRSGHKQARGRRRQQRRRARYRRLTVEWHRGERGSGGRARGAEWRSQLQPGLDSGARSERFGLWIALGDLDADGFDEIAVSTGFGGIGKKMQFPKVFIYSATGGVPSARSQTVARRQRQIEHEPGLRQTTSGSATSTETGAATWSLACRSGSEGGVTEAGACVRTSVDRLAARRWCRTHAHCADLVDASSRTTTLGHMSQSASSPGIRPARTTVWPLDYLVELPRARPMYSSGPIVATDQIARSPSHAALAPAGGVCPAGGPRRVQLSPTSTATGFGDAVVRSTECTDSGSCDSVGAVYVFIAQGTAATGTTGWTRYLLQPPTVDVNFGAFGWSTVTVPGSSLIFIGEHGRDVGSVSAARTGLRLQGRSRRRASRCCDKG